MYITMSLEDKIPDYKTTRAIRCELLDYTVNVNKDAVVVENTPSPWGNITFMVYHRQEDRRAAAAIVVAPKMEDPNDVGGIILSAFNAGAEACYVFSDDIDQVLFAENPKARPGINIVEVTVGPKLAALPVLNTDDLILHPENWD